MTQVNRNGIYISVDPGFGDGKIVINGELLKLPRTMVDITGSLNNFMMGTRSPGLVISKYNGRDWLIGEKAQALVTTPEQREKRVNIVDVLNSYERFSTDDAEISIMTAVGLSLVKYAEITKKDQSMPNFNIDKPFDENSAYNIYVIVSLPQDAYDEKAQTVKQALLGEKLLEIDTETGKHRIKIKLNEDQVMLGKQVNMAYMGTVLNDEGELKRDSIQLKKLPALIIDGGQKTIADFLMTEIGYVDSATSNTDYAMNNVYEEVAKRLREMGREDATLDLVTVTLRGKKKTLNYVDPETGNTKTVDLRPIEKEVQNEICNEYIKYLNHKYNNLMDVEQIIITGGTGAAFYEHIMEYIRDNRAHLADNVYLTDYDFYGKKISPEYAIAVGAYKTLRQAVKSANKKAS